MKNKLLVSVFAAAIAAFAFTSCENKSDVVGVCTDMVKETLHKSARSLAELDGQKLTLSEFEFLGGVNDNRLVYRTIAFGNGVFDAKSVDTLTYEYGEWMDNNTVFTLNVTPRSGEPYRLLFSGNSLITPENRALGGEGSNNTARVEKWEKTLASFPSNEWEATFLGDVVADSVFEDSVKVSFIGGAFKYDTIRVFKGKMDTLAWDTTCYIRFLLERDPATLANTGHYYKHTVRSKYDRKTGESIIVKDEEKEYDFNWYFTDVTSDAKFNIALQSLTSGVEGDVLGISKYKVDADGKAQEFLLGGLTFKHPVEP